MTRPLLERTEIIGLLGLITALTAVATDIVIPAIGAIARRLFGRGWMIAFAVGRLFCGHA